MNMNVKRIFKLSFLLSAALIVSSFAQDNDWRNKDIIISFRDKPIGNFRFNNARAVKGVTDFQRTTGDKPSFAGANLEGVSFQNAVLSKANFSGANLTGVILSGADIRESDFKGANMQGANLYRATLQIGRAHV